MEKKHVPVEKNSFILYTDQFSTVDKLTNEEAGILLKELYRFVITGQAPKIDDRTLDIVITPFITRISKDQEAYEEKCEKNKKSILERWNKKDTNVYERIRTNTDVKNLYLYDIDNDIDIDNKKENSKRKTFTKPSLEEIRSYCEERKNSINAEQFFNFYEAKDWFVGKNKMKDWKACVRTWEQRNKKTQSSEVIPEWFDKTNSIEPLSEQEKQMFEKVFMQ